MENHKHLWMNTHSYPQTIYIYKDLEGNIISGNIVNDSPNENPYSEESIYRDYVQYVGIANKFIKNIKPDNHLNISF